MWFCRSCKRSKKTPPRPCQFDVPAAGEIDAYLRAKEAQHKPFLAEVCCKHVIWADAAKTRKDLCVVYIHGWSGSSREMEPFPTQLARSLGANLYCHRLVGHGLAPQDRGSATLASVTLDALYCSAVEAFAIGTRLGDKLIVVGCSTGATLAMWLLVQDWAKPCLHSAVIVSPAFDIVFPKWNIFKHIFHVLPRFATWMLGLLKGDKNHRTIVQNELHAKYWTTTYPYTSVAAIFELYYQVEYSLDYRSIDTPIMVMASRIDPVVCFATTMKRLAKVINAKTQVKDMTHAKGNHVVIGDIFNEKSTNDEALSAALQFCRSCNNKK